MVALVPDYFMSYVQFETVYISNVLQSAGTSLQVPIVYVPSQLQVQWYHVDSLALAMVRVFTPWKSTNVANQVFFFFWIQQADLSVLYHMYSF